MASSSSAVPATDASVWRAIAGPTVQIPPPNSYVYYFPQGHREQFGNAAARNRITEVVRSPIHCRVISVGLFYHHQTEQPFARIILQPETNVCNHEPRPQNDDSESGIVSYAKVLPESYVRGHSVFNVPLSCAKSIFPPFTGTGFQSRTLTIKDVGGNSWEFNYIFDDAQPRYRLTSGWMNFVKAKGLVSGDSVVFIRKSNLTTDSSDHHQQDYELFVGIRRAKRYEGDAKKVNEEMEKAGNGKEFEVLYYPKIRLPDFVVTAERVKESELIPWNIGMLVRMKLVPEVGQETPNGEIKQIFLLQTHGWRKLQVTWDKLNNGLHEELVSPWELEQVRSAQEVEHALSAPPKPLPRSPPSEKFKALAPVHHRGVQIRDRSQNPNQITNTDLPLKKRTVSDIKDDDAQVGQQESSKVGGGSSSFRLFGQTIHTFENRGEGSEKPK